jgi:hypothetical protein
MAIDWPSLGESIFTSDGNLIAFEKATEGFSAGFSLPARNSEDEQAC